MIKIFCDICEKNMKNENKVGYFSITSKSQIVKATKGGKMNGKQTEEFQICGECTEKILNKVKNLKK